MRTRGDLRAVLDELKSKGKDELRSILADALAATADNLLRAGVAVRLLDEQGEDLSDLGGGLLTMLRKIGHGQVLPGVLVRLQGKPGLMERVASMPIPQQRVIADGKPIKLAVRDNGTVTHRLCDPVDLTWPEVEQVFAKDHIRDEREQIAWLRRANATPKADERAVRVSSYERGMPIPQSVRVDRRRKGIIVTGREVFIPQSDLREYCSQLAMRAAS